MLSAPVWNQATVKTVSIHEAKAQLSRLLDLVAGGDSFIIADDGKPIAKVIPFDAPAVQPAKRLDFMKDQLKVPADFDALGEAEIETMFLGGDDAAGDARAPNG
jgi:prevent-host-death family protein